MTLHRILKCQLQSSMVVLVLLGCWIQVGTAPPVAPPTNDTTSSMTSYQVLQAILSKTDRVHTVGYLNARFVLITEKHHLFDLSTHAWDNTNRKLTLENVTTVEQYWPSLLAPSGGSPPITLDPPDENTLLTLKSGNNVDQLLWIHHDASACLYTYMLEQAKVNKLTSTCGAQPGVASPTTRYVSSAQADTYYLWLDSTPADMHKATIGSLLTIDYATNCTNYRFDFTVGFEYADTYYLFNSDGEHLDIVDVHSCVQSQQMALKDVFVCAPDPPTTPKGSGTGGGGDHHGTEKAGGKMMMMIVIIIVVVIVVAALGGIGWWFTNKSDRPPGEVDANPDQKESSSSVAGAGSGSDESNANGTSMGKVGYEPTKALKKKEPEGGAESDAGESEAPVKKPSNKKKGSKTSRKGSKTSKMASSKAGGKKGGKSSKGGKSTKGGGKGGASSKASKGGASSKASGKKGGKTVKKRGSKSRSKAANSSSSRAAGASGAKSAKASKKSKAKSKKA